MLRGGLRHLIGAESRYEVCGEASSAAEAIERIPAIKPDLVVMDITLPDRSGLELLKDLQAFCPEIPVLVYSMHDEMLYAERVLRAGGRGYLPKGSDSDQFLKALDEVLAGSVYLSKKVSRHIVSRMAMSGRPSTSLGPAILTDRELEIFQLLGQGINAAQIGEKLHISPRTVDAHRGNIRTKLSLPDAAAVIREAVLWVELGKGGGKSQGPA
jgi:DNA-binding NarL/FixJ family response regulator